MMYISVFPIAISVRRTNVYEERSLGIYASMERDEDPDREPNYIGAHLRKQLSFDLWYVFLGLFIISIVEVDRIQDSNDASFNLFNILFEIVSAYGTVGLSIGYPGVNAAFSSQFRVLSKLVIISMQIRGRHRGLPYALDRAVLLPSEELDRAEVAEAEKNIRRRNSNFSEISAVAGQRISPLLHPDTAISTAWERVSLPQR
jgi:Trk-type K+ transport system membrane component